ncbi:MAG TPA: hypothetical protein VF753_03930 [Terriglobales bacterium]
MVRVASWSSAVLFLTLVCRLTLGQAPQADASRLSNGTVSGNTYHNPDLGIRYEFPSGWSVNDPNHFMKPEHQFSWQEGKAAKGESKSQCFKTVLFVSAHPDGMHTNEYDPMATLTVVDPRCTAGVAFPTSIDDQQQIQSAGDQVINHLAPPAVEYKTHPHIRAFNNGGKVTLEISRQLTLNTFSAQRQNIQQVKASTLIMEINRYWVIWTFVSADDGNLNKMREGKIYFDSTDAAPSGK